jgi:hypothetical protein
MALASTRTRWTAIIVVVSFVATACAGAARDGDPRGGPSAVTDDASPADEADPDLERPPPVTVRFGDQSIEIDAYTYCYGSVCATGYPPDPLPDIGSAEELTVEFPLDGWSFTAIFTPAGERCGRQQHVPLRATEDGEFVLGPAGHAGTYDVTLFGDLANGGDLVVTFRWTTSTEGPLPEPEARLAIVTDHDGRIDSYGVELEVSNLVHTPDDASATITVRSLSGQAVTFDARQSRMRCLPEGTVYWDGPDNKGLAAAALSGDTFFYEVELVLDGDRYVGTGTWPADEIVGNEPSVALEFTPELPGVS